MATRRAAGHPGCDFQQRHYGDRLIACVQCRLRSGNLRALQDSRLWFVFVYGANRQLATLAEIGWVKREHGTDDGSEMFADRKATAGGLA